MDFRGSSFRLDRIFLHSPICLSTELLNCSPWPTGMNSTFWWVSSAISSGWEARLQRLDPASEIILFGKRYLRPRLFKALTTAGVLESDAAVRQMAPVLRSSAMRMVTV